MTKKEQIDRHGYMVIKYVFTAAEIDIFRE